MHKQSHILNSSIQTIQTSSPKDFIESQTCIPNVISSTVVVQMHTNNKELYTYKSHLMPT